MDTTEREKLSLNPDTTIMDTATMVDMDIMVTTEREKLRLSLNQDITIMVMAIMGDMDTMDIMEREKLLLNVDIVIMATMAKEKLNLVIIIMVMIMDMVMVMAMDIMVKQQLFIDLYSFSYIGLICPPTSKLK